jgi:hypothetical protein
VAHAQVFVVESQLMLQQSVFALHPAPVSPQPAGAHENVDVAQNPLQHSLLATQLMPTALHPHTKFELQSLLQQLPAAHDWPSAAQALV